MILRIKSGQHLELRDTHLHPKRSVSFGDENGDPEEWALAYQAAYPEKSYFTQISETQNFKTVSLYEVLG